MPGAPGPGRSLKPVLLSAPDDYLLDIARRDLEATWVAANASGEVVGFDVAPPVARLLSELSSPSLFASARLVVVRDARPYLEPKTKADDELKALARALGSLPAGAADLLLAAVRDAEPTGPVADALAAAGEARHLPLPPAPKPWDHVRVTPAQRTVLVSLIRRVAPSVADDDEVVSALCEAYGFRPRELAQAAERLALAGAPSAEAVREMVGVGECSISELEDAIIARDPRAAARLLARLAAGAPLLGWRGDTIEPGRLPAVLVNALARLARQALALRAHARGAGLADELDPGRCARGDWYPKSFKPRLYPRLVAEIEQHPGSPVERLSPWVMHRSFKAAAAHTDPALLDMLGALGRNALDRVAADEALAQLTPIVLTLLTAGGAPAARRQPSRRA